MILVALQVRKDIALLCEVDLCVTTIQVSKDVLLLQVNKVLLCEGDSLCFKSIRCCVILIESHCVTSQ